MAQSWEKIEKLTYFFNSLTQWRFPELKNRIQLTSPSLVNIRVIYDRVLNKKNNFEIPAFFMFERGKSRAGNSK